VLSQEKIEKHIGLMIVLILVVISFGGLAQIVPLIFDRQIAEPVPGLVPLNALQFEGRDIYIREGCHVCHTQMIRTLRSETERYGHHSLAGEHVYEHPFLWGSKRTGPDLARIGGRYSDDWHSAHLFNPRDVVPNSNMPAYKWLVDTPVDDSDIEAKFKAMRMLGVPYTAEDIQSAKAMLKGKTEEDALIAYLQQLGTHLNKP